MNYLRLMFGLGWMVSVSATPQSLDAGSQQLHTILKEADTATDKNVTYEDYLQSLDDRPSLLRVAIYGLGMISLCNDSPVLTEQERYEWLPVARSTILARLALYLAPGGHPDLTPGGPAEKLSREVAAILIQIPLTVTAPIAAEIKTCLSAIVFTALRDGMCFLPQWQSEGGELTASQESLQMQPDWHALKTQFWATAERWRNAACVIGTVLAIVGYLLHNTARGNAIRKKIIFLKDL